MLFSSLSDPIDHARAQAAFEAAWNEIRWTVAPWLEEQERARLVHIVATLAPTAMDEDDLAKRATEHYRRPATS